MGLYYLCSQNKVTDQLRGHREADLRLCFRIFKKKQFSHDAAQFEKMIDWIKEANHVMLIDKIG